ncbi:MAG: hypothetical protein DIU69_09680 [Bacillota bacterium]|nr:MAG: hypothetical protein DIU69_09680 [Bacillota bacterium]
MWPVTSDPAPVPPAARVAAVALVAVALRLLDDVVDREVDRATGRPNWAEGLGAAATAYALAALATAAALSARDTLSLFWAGYAWGMAHDGTARLPLGLTARQETALALVLSLATVGLAHTLGAVALVGSIQLLDDWLDLRTDRELVAPGAVPRNWAGRLGRMEAFLLGVALGLAAAARDPLQAVTAWAVAALFMARSARRGGHPLAPGPGGGPPE